VQRLEKATGLLDIWNRATTCKAMRGLVAEGEEILVKDGDRVAKDAAITPPPRRSSTTRSPPTAVRAEPMSFRDDGGLKARSQTIRRCIKCRSWQPSSISPR